MADKEFRIAQMGVLKTLKGNSIKDCIDILDKTIEFLKISALYNELQFDDDWSKGYIDEAPN
ncbi:hypothetical protein [Mariniflexile sp. AS56]|uniref:hypothetical protein n=1 Tax=Flavobacteriaceae TaxID=49546 RepID=UPI0026F140D7|nr:hypothetical protein [Mariniflexile sp. AS56]MDO7174190.1 hypothetical protein [Mariniflexile sp. AS56]